MDENNKNLASHLFTISLCGLFYGTYTTCESFRYVNDTMVNKILTAIVNPLAYALMFTVIYVFMYSVIAGVLTEQYGMKISLILAILACLFITLIYAKGESKYITTREAIENAYEDGYLDGVNDEYNDFYYTDTFKNEYNYRPAEKDD